MSELKSILIVDDQEDIITILQDFFEMDYQVFTASNGTEAIDILYNNKIDILLSDIIMPNGDGVWLLNKIKEHSSLLDSTKIFYMTGQAHDADIKEIEKYAIEIFNKPFKIPKLLKTIEDNS